MGTLDHLEPKGVFRFFEEITKIPHGSGHTKEICDYITDFARVRGHETSRDAAGNILVTLPATAGREKLAPIMLQGHLDMVAVKTEDADIDLTRDALRLVCDGDELRADGTSLGADDGIAIAYFMALMDDPSLPHPRLYLLMTTDEETGMDGARALDPAWLKSRYFVNIDSEDEGVFLAGCAGGGRVHMTVDVPVQPFSGKTLALRVDGLLGGHSGQEIIKRRGNACHIMGEVLAAIVGAGIAPGVVSLSGGTADNVIPSEAHCVLSGVREEEEERIRAAAASVEQRVKETLAERDPGVTVTVEDAGAYDGPAAEAGFAAEAAAILAETPDGIRAMSENLPDMVKTSLNLGVMRFDAKEADANLHLDFSVRSSVAKERDALLDELCAIAKKHGASASVHGVYPGWEYDPASVIAGHFAKVYRAVSGREACIRAIHAGVECGLFKEKRPDLDCVSLGPNLADVHSVNEHLSVSSAKRTWELLLAALERWELQITGE